MTAQTRAAGAKPPVGRASAIGRFLTTREDLSPERGFASPRANVRDNDYGAKWPRQLGMVKRGVVAVRCATARLRHHHELPSTVFG